MRLPWRFNPRTIRESDPILIGSALCLTLIGIALIYAAQYNSPDADMRALWTRQITWLGVALIGFFIAAKVPLRLHEVLAYVYLGALGLILIGILVLEHDVGGRWIALGPAYLQPSEFGKLAVLFALCRYLAYLKRPLAGWQPLMSVALLVGPITLLVLKQPDLGTSLVFMAMTFILLFWGGIPPLTLFFLVSPVISLVLAFSWISFILFIAVLITVLALTRPRLIQATAVVGANLLFGIITPIVWNHLLPYQRMRILIFLDPGADPRRAGYQIIQSKVAIGSGGIFGKGFLGGTQTGLHFLPAKHTDFIFSVCGEEFGFWGATLVLILFAVYLWRAISIGDRARNRFGRFLAIGIAGIAGFQLLVNVGMTVGLMPVTGIPLPFVSYGGSSLLLFWTLTGLLVNVRRNWLEY